MRIGGLIAILLLMGCGDGRTIAVDLRGVSAALAVVATLDDQGAPVRLSSAFGLDQGRLTFGAPPAWTLEESESTMVVVAFDAAGLDVLYDKFGARAERPVIEFATPPGSPTFDPSSPLEAIWLEAALGPSAVVFAADGSAGAPKSIDDYPALQSQLMIRLPVDPEACAPGGERRLYPFGRNVDGALDDVGRDLQDQRLLDVARIDDETALVAGPGLFVVPRGGAAARGLDAHDAPDVWVPYERLWSGRRTGEVVSIALMPADGPGPRTGVIVAHSGGTSWIHEIEASSEGVRLTRTLAETRFHELEDIDVDARGRFVVVSEDATVFDGSLEAPSLRENTIEDDLDAEGLTVRWTGQSESPVVVGTDRALFLANAGLSSWARLASSLIGEPRDVSELTRLADRDEIWAAGDRALLLVRRGRTDWEEISLKFPPRFLECAVPDGPLEQLASLRNVDAIAGGDGYLYISQENCNAVIALRLSDSCVSVLTPDGGRARTVVTRDGDDKQLRAATYEAGQLLMVGDEGRVLTNLPPPS